jgi:hypothetical protein
LSKQPIPVVKKLVRYWYLAVERSMKKASGICFLGKLKKVVKILSQDSRYVPNFETEPSKIQVRIALLFLPGQEVVNTKSEENTQMYYFISRRWRRRKHKGRKIKRRS